MSALAYNLTQGSGQRAPGNAGPKPPANKPPHPSVSGKGPKVGTTPTSPLAPLSPSQIRQQATRTVQSAYAPAVQEIRSQQARAQAIYDKQSSDNQFYLGWLATQQAAIQAHNDAANQQLESTITSLTNPAQVPQPTGGGANAAEVAGLQQSDRSMLNATGANDLTGISQGNSELGAAALGNASAVMAGQSKESAQLQTSLDQLRTMDTNLLARQASDLTNAIQNAQKTEIAKAEYAQNTAIAENKLGIQQADTASLINQRAANTKIAQENATTSQQRLQLQGQRDAALTAQGWAHVAQSDKTYQLNVAKYNQSVAKDIYERNHSLGPYKTPSGKSPYLGMASQNVIIKHIQAVSGQIDTLVNQGMSAQDAWHAIQRGYYVLGGKKYSTGLHEPDAVILNAALNTSSRGAGLSPGDVKTLTNEGIDPNRLKQLLKEAAPPSPQGAASAALQGLTGTF